MFDQIKQEIDRELFRFVRDIDRLYSLSRLSPVLFHSIKDFVFRDGKRVRPILFVVGYLGFAKKACPGLYRSALSLEFLHDFMLIHDDIIDKSALRRGRPSMHTMLNSYLRNRRNVTFSGQDLSIVLGDILYALAIQAFLSVEEDRGCKERGLRKFIDAAIYTGSGEFIELVYGTKGIERITRQDIFKVYDYKTAYYTFACPLAIGAILAGTDARQVNLLLRYGLCVGRAFQIKDDILGIFSEETEIGKSNLTDLQEGKKTLLVWHAYRNASRTQKAAINKILGCAEVTRNDLLEMRRIMTRTKSLEYARRRVVKLLKQSQRLLACSHIKPRYKASLLEYAEEILAL